MKSNELRVAHYVGHLEIVHFARHTDKWAHDRYCQVINALKTVWSSECKKRKSKQDSFLLKKPLELLASTLWVLSVAATKNRNTLCSFFFNLIVNSISVCHLRRNYHLCIVAIIIVLITIKLDKFFFACFFSLEKWIFMEFSSLS